MAEAFVFSPCKSTGRRQRNAPTTNNSSRQVDATRNITGGSALVSSPP